MGLRTGLSVTASGTVASHGNVTQCGGGPWGHSTWRSWVSLGDRAVAAWAPGAAVAPSDRGPCCSSAPALSSSAWGDGKEKGTFTKHLLCDQTPRGRLCSRISSGSADTIASVSIDGPCETPEKLNELPQLGEVEPESEFPLGPLQSRGWRGFGGVNRAELRVIGGFVPPPFPKWSWKFCSTQQGGSEGRWWRGHVLGSRVDQPSRGASRGQRPGLVAMVAAPGQQASESLCACFQALSRAFLPRQGILRLSDPRDTCGSFGGGKPAQHGVRPGALIPGPLAPACPSQTRAHSSSHQVILHHPRDVPPTP